MIGRYMMGTLNWGKCALCGSLAEPSHTCRMCGIVACTRCFATAIGMCRPCSGKVNSHLSSHA